MDELDSLAGLAAAADQTAAPAGAVATAPDQVQPEQHVPGPDEQAADIINGFAGMLAGYAPDTASIWTPEARQASAAAIAPVLVKYNFSLSALPCELVAGIVVGPLLWQTSRVVGEKIKADRAAKLNPQAGQAAVPRPGAPSGSGLVDSTGQPLAAPPAALNEAPAVARHPQMALYE
jgi:hypothetical protein